MSETNEWRTVVLLTIRETASKTKEGCGFGEWVIMKLKNGKYYNVTLRAGSYWTRESTKEKVYPNDGLTDWDLDELKKKSKTSTDVVKSCACGATRAVTVWDEVRRLLDRKSPPPVPVLPEPPATNPEPPAAGTIPEAPW